MITRRLLREDVHAAVTDLILRGELEPGARINESRLSEQLGVSRTPLREALHRLEQEGFLRSEPNQGFIVHPLTEREVRDLYPVLWMLEGAALREAMDHGGVDLARLKLLDDERLASRHDLVREYEIDVEWHAELVRSCPNALLLDLIRHVKQIARRYLRLDIERLDAAISGHRRIIAALEAGEVDAAVEQLRQHWTHGMEATLSWVRELRQWWHIPKALSNTATRCVPGRARRPCGAAFLRADQAVVAGTVPPVSAGCAIASP